VGRHYAARTAPPVTTTSHPRTGGRRLQPERSAGLLH